MKIKPRVWIAAVIVLIAIIMTAVGVNTFTQSIGYLAAGYLFGKQGSDAL